MACHLCGKDKRSPYRRITGYVRDRAAGGANQVTLREETGEVACEDCISKLRAGIDPRQERLL